MPDAWRTVRVFISSTFRDMQAERDHLIRFVFPRLREKLLPRRIHLVDVDLRWGVTSEQNALEVCREIIDECSRFVCILGGRYGTMAPGKDRSVTAEEVHYRALDRVGGRGRCSFYLRSEEATRSIPEEAARAGGYVESDPANAQGLADLKREVAAAGFEPFVYDARWDGGTERLVGLEAFGNRVYEDFLASIDEEYGTESPEALDEFAEEAAAMEAFVQKRVERYVVGSRQSVFDELTAFAQDDGESNSLAVTGAPGCGKSALLGKFSQDCARDHPDDLVVSHFVGASAGSTDVRRMLRRLCHALTATTGEREIPQDVKKLVPLLGELLELVSQRQRVVLVLDALNQLDPTDNAHSIYWLPHSLPANVRVIVSSLEHPALEALRRRGKAAREIPLTPLEEADSRLIIQAFLERYRKHMEAMQIAALLGKREAGNPLYLLAALEELRTLGIYEEIPARIEELPEQVRPLFLWILRRLESDPGFRDAEGRLIGADLVRTFVSYLGVSRYGLSETELAELIAPGDSQAEPSNPTDAQGNVAALICLLRPYLMHRGELLDFYHTQLREAVEGEYLGAEQERLAAHCALTDYFRRTSDPAGDCTWTGNCPHALRELPYHQVRAGLADDVQATLTDLGFIGAKLRALSLAVLVDDYDLSDDCRPPDAAGSLSWHYGKFLRSLFWYSARSVEDIEKLLGQYGSAEGEPDAIRAAELADLSRTILESEKDWNVVYGAAESLVALAPNGPRATLPTSRHKGHSVRKETAPVFMWGIHVDIHPVTVDELRAAYPRYDTSWANLPGSIPATDVSWAEASVFALRRGMRLPSVQDWLAAAGVLLDGRTFPWGNDADETRCNCKTQGYRHPTPVDLFDPVGASPYGVCDLMGNVWEYTSSVYPDTREPFRTRSTEPHQPIGRLLKGSPRTALLVSGNPTIMGGDSDCPLRGGGLDGEGVRKRDICLALNGNSNIGFRCVRDFDQQDFYELSAEVHRDCLRFFRRFMMSGLTDGGVVCSQCKKESSPNDIRAVCVSSGSARCVCRDCAPHVLAELVLSGSGDGLLHYGHSLAAKVSRIRREPFAESRWAGRVEIADCERILEEWG